MCGLAVQLAQCMLRADWAPTAFAHNWSTCMLPAPLPREQPIGHLPRPTSLSASSLTPIWPCYRPCCAAGAGCGAARVRPVSRHHRPPTYHPQRGRSSGRRQQQPAGSSSSSSRWRLQLGRAGQPAVLLQAAGNGGALCGCLKRMPALGYVLLLRCKSTNSVLQGKPPLCLLLALRRSVHILLSCGQCCNCTWCSQLPGKGSSNNARSKQGSASGRGDGH